jgi:hypothetical protein
MMKKIFLLAVLIVTISCSDSNNSIEADSLKDQKVLIKDNNLISRIDLNQIKSYADYREIVNNLSSENRRSLWMEKLSFLEEQFPSDWQYILEEIRYKLISVDFNKPLSDEDYLEDWEPLLSSFAANHDISSDEIYFMFHSLRDIYLPDTNINSNKNYLTTTNGFSFESPIFTFDPDEKPDCDCRWYCGGYEECDGLKPCEPTTAGCGPIGLWSCTDICD